METDKKPANLPLSFVDWLKANPYVDCPITQYNKYLISHHLTVLSERIALSKLIKVENYKGKHNEIKVTIDNYTDAEVDVDFIQQILEDYKKEIGV